MSQIRGGSREAAALARSVMEVRLRLSHSPYWSLRRLACEVEQGRVVLRGTVPTYYLKQVAQAVASQTVDKEWLVSEITVCEEV
jgi:osmotically-inducible protein OsmY